MPRTTLTFLCLYALAISAFSQQQKLVSLPIEIETEIKGIEVKIILLDFKVSQKGAYGNMIFAFKNPQTGEWIYFDAPEVRISPTHILMDSFKLQLQKSTQHFNIEFAKSIIEKKEDGSFVWKCRCEDTMPPLF